MEAEPLYTKHSKAKNEILQEKRNDNYWGFSRQKEKQSRDRNVFAALVFTALEWSVE